MAEHVRRSRGDQQAAGETPSYYIAEPGSALSDYFRTLLLQYSRIPEEDLERHLHAVRDKLWAAVPYPCVGYWSFLTSNLRVAQEYPLILEKARGGARVLDVGAGLGQELRVLVHDGAPSDNLYATDISTVFWPAGYELFNDADSFQAHFIQSDMFDEKSPVMTQLRSCCDVIYLGLFLHLFDYELQVKASCNIVRLASGPGSIIAGKSGGWEKAGEQNRIIGIQNEGDNKDHPTRFRHDKDSFIKMWEEVSLLTNTKWNVAVDFVPDQLSWRKGETAPDLQGHQPYWLFFSMTRIE